MSLNEYTKRVNKVIGADIIENFSDFKFNLLCRAYDKLLAEKSTIENITDKEIIWVFEMVRDGLVPNDYSRKILDSLGYERLKKISLRQARFLDRNFDELIEKRSLNDISSDEIIGVYEIITEHVAPIEVELIGGYYEENNELYIYY
jgi:hypothetical protein